MQSPINTDKTDGSYNTTYEGIKYI